MELPKPSLSVLALIGANLVPLLGVLLLDWDAAVIVLLYWTENVVIGFYNILRMTLVKVDSPAFHLGKLFTIPFFCLHFGGFCALHGLFLLVFFDLGNGVESLFPKGPWSGQLLILQLMRSVVTSLWRNHPEGMEWPVIFLFVSHGISFTQNYLGKGEYAVWTVAKLMTQPYKRIVILHITIIAGGVPIMMLGSPIPLLCILVFLKLCVDISLHIKEHKIRTDDKQMIR